MNPFAIAGIITIGISLGLTGAGGSILTVPVLVYLVGLPPTEAVGVSLCIVAIAAAVGAVQRWKCNEIHLKAALMFGGAGMVGAAIGAKFTHVVDEKLLMVFFTLLMIIVGFRMIFKTTSLILPLPECKPARCILAGAGTGMITGFLGVGGGFILMPALIRFARLPIAMATGTSLAVIAASSTVGSLAHQSAISKNAQLTLIFAAIAVIGTLLGKRVANHLPQRMIQKIFGSIVLITAAGIIAETILQQHP
ncbi:MAG: sulfite exporter TauE/SafE family protein [Akkermansiaceae bacterium]|jgi:uncharacterized membrane protein YfcA